MNARLYLRWRFRVEHWCLIAAFLASGSNVNAFTAVRVDDSATVVSQPVSKMQWRTPVPGRHTDHVVQTRVNVLARLNLAAWLGQGVRIYMVLEPSGGNTFTASWRGGARLLPGTLQSGQRTLVFVGRVNTAMFEEPLVLDLATDGRTLVAAQSLHFHFELEVA